MFSAVAAFRNCIVPFVILLSMDEQSGYLLSGQA